MTINGETFSIQERPWKHETSVVDLHLQTNVPDLHSRLEINCHVHDPRLLPLIQKEHV